MKVGFGFSLVQDQVPRHFTEAIEFLQEWKSISDVGQTCEELLLVNTEVLPSEVKGGRSKSVLFDACRQKL